jgi:site-specific DNA recombinase
MAIDGCFGMRDPINTADKPARALVGSLERNRPRRICIYCRVSTDERSGVASINAQVRLLKRLADAQSGEDVPDLDRVRLVDVIDDDTGVSGTLPPDQRPGGQRLIQLGSDSQLDEVWIYGLDRPARSLGLLIEIEHFLAKYGVALVSLRDLVHTKT